MKKMILITAGILLAARGAATEALTRRVVPGAARRGSDFEVNVTWQDDLATIRWQEPLADPGASGSEVPFSLVTGPYIGWLTSDSAAIGWEVVAERAHDTEPCNDDAAAHVPQASAIWPSPRCTAEISRTSARA